MAQYSDQYAYQVVASARGFDEIMREAKAFAGFKAVMEDTAEAADRVGPATSRAAKGIKEAGDATDRVRQAGARAGQTIGQFAYILDDAAYGSRGLRNQVMPLATSLLGFGVAGAAAGAIGTVLVGVFGEQIDKALAYAGVLDENLVKGMEKGSQAAETMADRLGRLRDEFSELSKPVKDQAAGITQAFEDAGAAAEARIGKVLAANGKVAQQVERERQDLERRLAEVEAKRAEFVRAGATVGLERFDGEIKSLRASLDGLSTAVEDRGLKALEDLRRQAVQSDHALQDLADAAKLAGETDLAEALIKQTEAARQAAREQERLARVEKQRAADAERQAAEDARRSEQEIERRNREAEAAEEKARRQMRAIDEARQAADRAEMDAKTRRLVEAFGPLLSGGINAGLRNAVAGGADLGALTGPNGLGTIATAQRMAGAGVPFADAMRAAQAMVEEQAAEVRAMGDAMNAVLGLMQQSTRNGSLARRRFDVWGRQMYRMGMMQGNPVNGRF